MNPWDLSCRSKLGGEPGGSERPRPSVAACASTEPRPTGVAGNSPMSVFVGSSPPNGPQNSPITTDHLAAYSRTIAKDGRSSISSSPSPLSSSSSSLILSSSRVSSFPSPSSSQASSALSSLAPSPSSTRSNSIEISEEIQLVQRVVMFNEQAAAVAAAKMGLERAIDQLNNTNERNAISNNNNNNNTDSSSSSSSSSRSSSSSGSSSSGCNSTGGGEEFGAGCQPPSQDRKARKKDQNRRAAYNYRRKKMEEKNRMREEEMRLVYSRVCLIGYAEKLEGSIMCILQTKTRKILDKDGSSICFLCPICLQSCDNIMNLRSHLNAIHNADGSTTSNNNNDDVKI